MLESVVAWLTVPNLVLAAFLLLTLAGLVAILRSFLRWYLGLAAMEETLGRLEERMKRLQEMFEEEADDAPRGPSLPQPGEKDLGLPGPRG